MMRPCCLAALLCTALAPAQNTQTVLHQHFGTQFDEYYAESVTWMGDVNRDGVDDYVIGGSRYANSQGEVGIVQMISGATRGVLYSISSGSPGSRFGFSLTWIGDQDGDRVREWVVGAPYDGTRGTEAGRVYCFSGADGRFLWQAYGSGARQRFGWSLAPFGRIGVGSPGGEVAVGAPSDGSGTSRVWMLAGAGGGVLASVDAPPHHRLGTSVAADGPLLAVGAPGSGPNAEGSVRFFWLAGTSVSEFPTYLSFDPGAGIGASITSTSLPNGANFAIGGAGTATIPGRVDLVRATITTNSRVATLVGTRNGDAFGYSVASGRDADGDGVQDLLVGAPRHSLRGPSSGAIHLFSGRTLTRNYALLGGSGEAYGWVVRFLGDLDGDGFDELGIGAPLAAAGATTRAGRLDVASVNLEARLEPVGGACTPALLTGNVSELRPDGRIVLTVSGLPSSGASGVWALGLPADPVDLSAIGMPGCGLFLTPLVTEPLATGSSSAEFRTRLPADPALTRDVLVGQAVLLAPGVNAAGAVTTRGLRMILGNR